jgi:hypothetical protein
MGSWNQFSRRVNVDLRSEPVAAVLSNAIVAGQPLGGYRQLASDDCVSTEGEAQRQQRQEDHDEDGAGKTVEH